MLPALLLCKWRQNSATSEKPRGKRGLPLEDLEREACAHGAYEEERGVVLIYDVLVEARDAVIADFDVGEEGEGPEVSGAEDEGVDVGG